MKSTISLLILHVILMQAIAQDLGEKDNSNKMTLAQHWKTAKRALNTGDIYTAINHLKEVVSEEPQNYTAAFKLANSYRLARDYKNAEKWYAKVKNSAVSSFPLAAFYYASMLKRNGEFEKAEEEFKKFSRSYRGDNSYYYRKIARSEEDGAELAMELQEKPVNVKIEHLKNVNKAYTEFSPILSGDSLLIYSALTSDTIITVNANNPEAKIPVTKFYTAKKENNEWVSGGKLEGPFNQFDVHVGNGAFSPEEDRFYFTKCEEKKGRIICDIWISRKNKTTGKWGDPEVISGLNTSKYTETHPAIGTIPGKNKEILYFATDRTGGMGGLDIWYAEYNNKTGTHQPPEHAGRRVNTIGDEVSPFYNPLEEMLYFSSNGFESIGGFDIFRSEGYERRWKKPENIGYPLNSSADDLYFYMIPEEKKGFIVSNREGAVALKSATCCDDILAFSFIDIVFALGGNVLEEKDQKIQTLENAKVELFEVSDEKEEILKDNLTVNQNGEFFFDLEKEKDYIIKASKEGYLSYKSKKIITTRDLDKSDTLHHDPVLLKPVPKGAVVLENIYYDFDSPELTEASKNELDTTLVKMLQDNPDLKVEVASHTDSKGEDSYNQRLSQKRAESVVNYLLNKGISADRLVAKGYGETQPVATNKTDEGRQKNRRTEFKILKKVSSSSENSTTPEQNPVTEKSPEKVTQNANVQTESTSEKPEYNIEYRVQISASTTPLDNSKFSDVQSLTVEKGEDGYYRYFAGIFKDLEMAVKLRKEMLAKGYDRSFVAAYKDGTKITIKKARSLQDQ